MKISVISDITFEPVLQQLRQQNDIVVESYQYAELIVPEIMQAGSRLEGVDVLIIHVDAWFFRYEDEYIRSILESVAAIAGNFRGNILLSNNLSNGRHLSMLKNNPGNGSLFPFESDVKKILAASNVYFYDVNRIISRMGFQNVYNFNLGFLYQMPYTKGFISALETELTGMIRFLTHPEKKAIFVDCDNTLWKGILGEDGLSGIQCDKNAAGIFFYRFQEFLRDKKNEGFILGLCSKNNEEDVKEAFAKLNMPLRWDDFLLRKVNWLNKNDNLREAAETLNIGLDSFIFIDDSDFEIASIQSLLPEISCLKLSPVYAEFLLLTDNFLFKRKRLTAEDLGKTEQYRAEQQRSEAKNVSGSFEDYVKSLDIRMDVTVNHAQDLPRLAQLTEKTNQFNFNKEPLSIAALEQFMSDQNLVYGLRVNDKFGDYGLVGLMLIEVDKQDATIRNYLLSCRALGRGIEDDFLNFVTSDLRDKGLRLKDIIFRETAKNAPARIFLEKIKTQEKPALT